MQAEDETNITELEILPDGRICVFGASREVLEMFDDMTILSGDSIHQRLNQHQKSCPNDVISPQKTIETATVETQRNNT